MGYTLTAPATGDEWRAFHDIRRVELFENRGRFGAYDINHADDYVPQNRPLLLKIDGRPVGTVRLDDLGSGTAVVRLVAIKGTEQGRGHGRALQVLIDEQCRQSGIGTLLVNAAPSALGYYEKGGWTRHIWDPSELVGLAESCIQMRRTVPPL